MDFAKITHLITSPHFLALTTVLTTMILFRYVANFLIVRAKKALATLGVECSEQIVDSFKNPLYCILIVIGLYGATLFLGLPPDINTFLNKAIKYLITIALLWAVYNSLGPCTFIFENVSKAVGARLTEDLKIFIIRLIKVLVFFLGAMATLQLWVDDVPALIGGLGLIGIAVALAAQDTLKNLFGSLTIILDGTFHKGDLVKINNIEGDVEVIGIRTTTLRDKELGLIIIPNATVISSPVVNYSRRSLRKVDWKISVRGSTPNSALEAIITQMKHWIDTSPLIEHDPSKATNYVFLDSFNEGMIDLRCQFFSKSADKMDFLILKDAALKVFKVMFEEHNVSITQPSTAIVLEKNEDE